MDVFGSVYVAGYSEATWGTPVNAHTGDLDGFVAKLWSNAIKGDVNGDGAIDLLDVVLCAQIARGWVAGTAQQREAADVDDDGDVDADDVTILSECVLGTRPTLP